MPVRPSTAIVLASELVFKRPMISLVSATNAALNARGTVMSARKLNSPTLGVSAARFPYEA